MEINRISDHAVDKYCNYMKIMHDKEVYLNIAKEQIKKLFDKAIPELSSGLVRRVIDNDFIDAEYYRYMGWRFVVCNCTIVTIERNIFGKSLGVS